MSAAKKYAKGDRVVHYSKAGAVRKVAKYTARVRWDGEDEDDTVNLTSLRRETGADIAEREHAARMKAWEATEPKHPHATVERAYFHGAAPTGQITARAEGPDGLRAAAAELLLLADWFDAKPKETL